MSRMIVDANVLTSAILGRGGRRLSAIHAKGIELIVPEAQILEVLKVLRRFGYERAKAYSAVWALMEPLNVVEPSSYAAAEPAARGRLHDRAQPDWPVLAAALTFDANVWSDDRDFFGVGVPVWSTCNIDRTYLGTGKDHG